MNCGKFHTGECRKRSLNCFECGEVGHFKRDCPLLIQFGGSGRGTVIPRNQSGGRSFVSNRQVTAGANPSIGRGGVVATTSQQGQNAQPNRPLTQARVFAMSQDEELAHPEVDTGKLIIFD